MASIGFLIRGQVSFKEITEVCLIGIGLASCWFYARSLLTGDLSNKSLLRWAVTILPLGMFIAWGLKIAGII
jgi:hypothetical protein